MKNGWKTSRINNCEYWVKSFENASEYGINEGRISKLSVNRDDQEIISYDRGWDIEPKTDEDKQILSQLIAKYN